MSVVALSYVNLVRTRRELERAYLNDDWDAIKDWDVLLAEHLNAAFDDPDRDNNNLVQELENILGLYSSMVDELPQSTAQQWLKPESSSR